ncbi:JmjC domain-containing protein [Thermomonospora umbrina]|uniref:JmjC domain-containing protein n=1 Tax=Thermomonospora umbrina TaxID=111806 RepID=UPI0014775CF0|nr:cupin domain-containing protein [Thermomonospora umbrina]
MIDPVGVEAFLADHWERRPLLVRRDDPKSHADLLTLADLDRILALSSIRGSDIRVVDNGQETPIAELAEGAGGPGNVLEVLYARYRAGATLAVNFLHERWEPLSEFCRALGAELSAIVHTNVYLTPAGRRGLVPHFDNHDVFVAQLHGSKHWRFYSSPDRLPLRDATYRPPAEGPGEPVLELDVHPGDMLYVPRGWVHEASSEEETSLHLTIGVQPVVWVDLLYKAVDLLAANDVTWRRGLPLGFSTDETAARRTAELTADLLSALPSALPVDSALADLTRRSVAGRQTVLDGHLLDLDRLDREAEPDLDSRLLRRPRLLWRLTHEDGADRIALDFHGKTVRLPAAVADEVEFVAGAAEFSPREIPGGLDDEGRLVLVRRLLHEGFLTFA